LQPQGERADRLVAFARRDESGAAALCIAPRLVAPLLDGSGLLPAAAFGETIIPVPFASDRDALTDAFTGRRCAVKNGAIAVSEALSTLPVALLLT
jgi:(1->4)-alpha-D-glucan 1-alpha-D-glucosylmutase